MSLTGITFANQKITPSDDGRLYGAMLADGILTGCGITFAAATLSVAEGSLLIGTRELRTSGETLSITGASSGYARVIIDIDLTRAATKTSFEQAQFKIQYAASVSAFPALIQQDINGSGTHYQAEFCVVSLGTAGITGIESRLHSAVVPVSSGGTGATTAAAARSNLGITLEDIGALPLTGGTMTGKMQNTYELDSGVEITHANEDADCGISINKASSNHGGAMFIGVGISGKVGIYDSTLEKWIFHTEGTNIFIDGLLYRHIYVGTSATPPSDWRPGDIYLQYQ